MCFGGGSSLPTDIPKAPTVTEPSVALAGEEAAKDAAKRSPSQNIFTSSFGLVNYNKDNLLKPVLGGGQPIGATQQQQQSNGVPPITIG